MILSRYGLKFSYVDTGDVDAVKDAITPKTKLIFIETPANPTLKLTDIRAVSEIKGDAKLVVDNTFLTPVSQVPLDSRRGHYSPQHYKIHRGTQFHGRRRDYYKNKERSRGPEISPERDGFIRVAVQCMAHDPGIENPRC